MSIITRITDGFQYGFRVANAVHSEPGLSREEQKLYLDHSVRVDKLKAGRRAFEYVNNRTERTGANKFRAAGRAGPQAEIANDMQRFRGEARGFTRYNPLGKQAGKIWRDWLVGTGYNFAPQFPKEAGKRAAANFEITWKAFFETKACDAMGDTDFYGLTKLAVMTMIECGEAIVRIVPRAWDARDVWGNPLPVPMQIKVLEPDYLYDGPTPNIRAGNSYFGGIEYQPGGQVDRYWLYDSHPGELGFDPTKYSAVDVFDPKTKAPQVIHLFVRDRPGQPRGVPWGALAVETLMEMGDLRRSLLRRKRLEYRIQTYIKSPKPNDQAKAQMFGSNVTDILNRSGGTGPTLPRSPEEMDSFHETMQDRAYDQVVEDNSVIFLPDTWDVVTNQMSAASDYAGLIEELKRTVMNGFGLPYEIGTGDLKMTTYSSGKIGLLSFKTEVASLQQMIINDLCVPVWNAFCIYGKLRTLWTYSTIPCDFRPDKQPPLEPEKEAGADIMELNMGVTSWQDQVRKRGQDPDELIVKIAEDVARFDKAGLAWVYGPDGIIAPGRFYKVATSGGSVPPSKTPADTDIADTGGNSQ